MADTINQPANQLRLIQANFQNLSRTIGNLFLSVVQSVLPYVNGLIIALQRLFSWLGNLLGIDLSKISSSVKSVDFSNIIDDTDDFTDGLVDAKTAADKLNKSIRSFDELKTISTKEDSDTGTGASADISGGLLDSAFEDIFSEYQEVWDKAFFSLENRAQEIADKIEKIFEPIKKIIEDFAVGDFFQAGQDVSGLVVSINNYFARAIASVDWHGIGQNIGNFLAGIDWTAIFSSLGRLIWEGINASIELWSGAFSKAPFETAFLSILALPAIVGFGSKLIGFIVSPFKNAWVALSPIIAPLTSSIGEMFSLWLGGAGTFGESFMAIFGIGGIVVIALAAVAATLGYVFATNEEVRESFNQAITAIKEGLQPALEFLTETLLPDLKAGWNRIVEILTPFGNFLENTFVSIWQDMINPALTYIGETVLPKLTETFENLWNNVLVPLGSFIADIFKPIIEIISDKLTILWENVVVPLADAVGTILGKAFEGICDIWNNTVIPILSNVIKVFQFLWNKVLSPIVNFLWNNLKPVFENVFKFVGNIIDSLKDIFGGVIDFITGIFSGDLKKACWGIVDIIKGILNTVPTIIENILNGAIAMINGLVNGINKITGIVGIPSIPNIPPIELPRLAKGGLVYNPTIAQIGEAGQEAVLPLTNRRTMEMIADSIVENTPHSNGYYDFDGVNANNSQTEELLRQIQQQNQLLREQNRILSELNQNAIVLDDNNFERKYRSAAGTFYRRTGSQLGLST